MLLYKTMKQIMILEFKSFGDETNFFFNMTHSLHVSAFLDVVASVYIHLDLQVEIQMGFEFNDLKNKSDSLCQNETLIITQQRMLFLTTHENKSKSTCRYSGGVSG